MLDPLNGARLKLVRAQEHLASLKAEIDMYLDEHPYELVAEKLHEHQILSARIVTQPPLRLSTIIGDCVTNSRAALDYIVWELTLRYFNPPFDVTEYEDRKLTAFPISKGPSEHGHAGHVQRLERLAKRGIPAGVIDEIRSVQPYASGNLALWWLHGLVNADKHRMLLLTVSYVPTMSFSISPLLPDYPEMELPDGTRQRKTVVDFFGTPRQVHHNGKVQVTLQDASTPREPVDWTLAQIVDTVANAIPRFERFLA